MINKNKMIIGINDKVWRKYTAYCLSEKVKVGDHLSDLLSDFLLSKQSEGNNADNERGDTSISLNNGVKTDGKRR